VNLPTPVTMGVVTIFFNTTEINGNKKVDK
jgi:hypothetical protein